MSWTVLKAVVNYHLRKEEALSAPSVFITGGCTLIRGTAMAVRTSMAVMRCEARLSEKQQHCFKFHGEDVGWGFNLLRQGIVPHVLTQHLVVHLAAHKAPTDLVPLYDEWPLNLTGRVLAVPLDKCA